MFFFSSYILIVFKNSYAFFFQQSVRENPNILPLTREGSAESCTTAMLSSCIAVSAINFSTGWEEWTTTVSVSLSSWVSILDGVVSLSCGFRSEGTDVRASSLCTSIVGVSCCSSSSSVASVRVSTRRRKKNAFFCYNVTKFPSSGSEIDCTRRLLTFSYLLSDDLYTSVYEIHPTFEVLSHDHREKKLLHLGFNWKGPHLR